MTALLSLAIPTVAYFMIHLFPNLFPSAITTLAFSILHYPKSLLSKAKQPWLVCVCVCTHRTKHPKHIFQ